MIINHTIVNTLLSLLIIGTSQWATADLTHRPNYWITSQDKQYLLSEQSDHFIHPAQENLPVISINTEQRYQVMDGFGFTLNGGSAMHLMNMTANKRQQLLTELFGNGKNDIGISYLRLSIGASDLDTDVFSYNDLPNGQTDPELKQFSIAKDRRYLLPVLKEILAINPQLALMASPWSPPAWMKSNNASKGGELLEQHYASYANYFVKYIQVMANEGINLQAITIQNEPLHPGNNPSLLMHAVDQAKFIKNHLGPAFRKHSIATQILIYDHNTDRIDYPISILNDPEANDYIYGSAFHLYGGTIEALTAVKQAHPDKHLYFTEQWVGAGGEFGGDLAWHIKNLIIGASRHWCRSVLEWNLAADPELKPHTDGGCTQCLGALTIAQDHVTRNVAYYVIAHASKFVPSGSIRIESSEPNNLFNVAFLRPDKKVALILLNTATTPQSFNIQINDSVAHHTFVIPAESVVSITL